MIKFIYFDVSGTLLYKPDVVVKIQDVLLVNGINAPLQELKLKHKLISELIHFPDVTNKDFYNHFNAELLRSMGIVPNQVILDSIFKNCTYLDWKPYEDADFIQSLKQPIGIISNFNKSLEGLLNGFFGTIFTEIFVSEIEGVAKPNNELYERAFKKVQLKPQEILYVGDSLKLDVEPAEFLGVKSLLIDRDDVYPSSPKVIKSLNQIVEHL